MNRTKHIIREAVRRWVSRIAHAGGLTGRAARTAGPRLLVLGGHDVGVCAGTAHMPASSTISVDGFRGLVRELGRIFDVVDLGSGLKALSDGTLDRPAVAWTFDDGYRGCLEHLLPLAQEEEIPVTVYIETGVLDGRGVHWTHKQFWAEAEMGEQAVAAGVADALEDVPAAQAVRALGQAADLSYRVKLVLKYDVDPQMAAAAMDAVFLGAGGNEEDLANGLYAGWDGVRSMAEGGLAIGSHTVSHPVLARLDGAGLRRELADSRSRIESETGREIRALSYPFGRPWDVPEDIGEVAADCGYTSGVTALPGTNVADTDRFRLLRLDMDPGSEVAVMAAEGTGILGRAGSMLGVNL